MKNKIIYILLALLITLTSCNVGGPGAESTPSQTPAETPENTPVETPFETPEETPGETPEETPIETPIETPEATPGETPKETPEETPDETPGDPLGKEEIQMWVMDGDHTMFDEVEFIDSNAAKTITTEIMGVSYTLPYKNSVVMELTGIKAHVYGDDYTVQVFVDAESGKIIKYNNIPYAENFNTEDEYKSFIAGLIDSNIDLSLYNYFCRTWYTIEEDVDYGTRSRIMVTNKFYAPESENEYVDYYSFEFIKKAGDVLTKDCISVTVFTSSGKISVETYALGYDEDDFSEILSHVDEMTEFARNYAEAYLSNRYFKDYTMDFVRVSNNFLFIKDGKAYLVSYIVSRYLKYGNPDLETNYGIAIVSCIK